MVRKLAIFIAVFIVCSLAFLPFSARADWQSFPSSQDSMISALNPDWNTGDAGVLRVGVTSDDRLRTLVQFDLSSISGSTVSSAILKLYYFLSGETPAGRWLIAYRVTHSWTETGPGVTWNKYDGTNPWATAGGDYTTTGYVIAVVPSSAGVWMTWDVTDIVKAWVEDGQPNYGFLIKDSTETGPPYGLCWFRSRDWFEAALRPKLEVTYTPPPPPPPPPGVPELSPPLVAVVSTAAIILFLYKRKLSPTPTH